MSSVDKKSRTVAIPVANAPVVKKLSDNANASMICGIIGIFFFGIILGPIAICLAKAAEKEIKENPETVDGDCQANAGLLL